MTMLFIVTAVVLLLAGIAFVIKELLGVPTAADLSPYLKKKYLFDTTSEFNLYKLLLELYGDRYHIFPQINYSHVVDVKKMDWREERRYRSRIDRKSADFVLCDKERVVPQLIIELDGGVHNFASKQKRDEFINDITKIVGLPILHLKTSEIGKDSVKTAVDDALKSAAS